jgi:8-oxo-dGTP pyrophosphatase MutT (NUDIX family)
MNREDFFNRQPGIIGERDFRQYAVLVIIMDTDAGPALIFEKRSESLDRQPGEICFPGGRLETGETPIVGAVRETTEELLVASEQIKVLGPGDLFISPYNIIIHPFIARLQNYHFEFSRDEVAGVFTVPIRFFLENKPRKYLNFLNHELPADFPYESIPGGKNYPWNKGTYEISFYHYKEEVIWGMTARIAESAIELIERYQLHEAVVRKR